MVEIKGNELLIIIIEQPERARVSSHNGSLQNGSGSKMILERKKRSKNDIKKLIEWLETYPRLTKGELTEKFEKQWSDYLGKKYSI